MGEMSPVQERDNLWKATGEKDYNNIAGYRWGQLCTQGTMLERRACKRGWDGR